jgi:hypothetical protein
MSTSKRIEEYKAIRKRQIQRPQKRYLGYRKRKE